MDKNVELKRNSSIELLRIIIMLMIIGHHFVYHGGLAFGNELNISNLWCKLLLMGGQPGVDIFIFISGYYLINDKDLRIKWKKILKLWDQVFFYSIGTMLLVVALGQKINNKYIIQSIFPINNSMWWFATTYIFLYLLHPYINRFLLSLNKEEYQKYIFFLLIIWSIIPQIIIANGSLSNLIEFMIYYSISGYIRLFGLFDKIENKKWVIVFIIITIIKFFIYIVPNIITFNHNWIQTHFTYVYNRNSILTIIQSISLFMIFIKTKIKYNRIINKIASGTFGVYLIHESNYIRPILWEGILKTTTYQNKLILIPYSIMSIILVFIICTFIDLLRKHIFNKTLNKINDKLSEKINYFSDNIYELITKYFFK